MKLPVDWPKEFEIVTPCRAFIPHSIAPELLIAPASKPTPPAVRTKQDSISDGPNWEKKGPSAIALPSTPDTVTARARRFSAPVAALMPFAKPEPLYTPLLNVTPL